MADRNWRDLTNEELRRETQRIAINSTSQEEVGRKLKEKFDYPYPPAVCYGDRGQFMGMMHGKDGETIQF